MKYSEKEEARDWIDWELKENCLDSEIKKEIVEDLRSNFYEERFYSLKDIKDYLTDLKEYPENFIESHYDEPCYYNFYFKHRQEMDKEDKGQFEDLEANPFELIMIRCKDIVSDRIQSVIDDIGIQKKLELTCERDRGLER